MARDLKRILLTAAVVLFQCRTPSGLLVDQDDQIAGLPKIIKTGNDELVDEDKPGLPFDASDFERTVTLAAHDFVQFVPKPNVADPTLIAGGFEGDIDNMDLSILQAPDPDPSVAHNAVRDLGNLWPSGIIPYVISGWYTNQDRAIIAKAMNEFHTKTCIRFIPRTYEAEYIHILPGQGCSSSVGKIGQVQSVSLGSGCMYVGVIVHELMHAVGFWHEQSRADRDENVQILWNNILPGMSYNFMKYDLNQISHLGVPYDLCSVMHYDAYAFSMNYQPTIHVIRPGNCQLGQRNGFSDIDLKKINKLYSCSGTTDTKVTPNPVEPTTTTTTTKPTKCVDTHVHCVAWAKLGECKKSSEYMIPNCPLSCKICSNECTDRNSFCEYWKNIGECDTRADYMNVYCMKSCGVCSVTRDEKCLDENKSCGQWSQSGYCSNSKHKKYMLLKCKKSCNKC